MILSYIIFMIYDNNGLYIEINERMSGKTTRLIENIAEYIIRTNEHICLMTVNRKMYDYIKHKLYVLYPNVCPNKIIYVNNTFHKGEYFIYHEDLIVNKYIQTKCDYFFICKNFGYNLRLYVDEFYYIKDRKYNLFLVKNGYYCTSIEEEDFKYHKIDIEEKDLEIFLDFKTWKRKKIIHSILNLKE
jgi:hypothetical protein